MPEIEFQLKRKEAIKREDEDLSIDKIINPDKYINGDPIEYRIFYSPIIIDTDLMHPVLEDDAEHTALFDKLTGEIYIVKCKYRNYKYITEHLSGRVVRGLEYFAIDDAMFEKLEKLNKELINNANA